jgi:TetR/AcrR family transcriptional regulator
VITILRRSSMVEKPVTLRALRREAARYERPETEREGAIVNAAIRLFGAKGYAGTRTADIAAAAGVTERTLFRYFPSKEKLYRRVIFPALLAEAVPRTLMEAGEVLALDAESFAMWHKRVMRLRLAAVKRSAPQLRLLVAELMTDDALRRKVIGIWKENLLQPLLGTVRRYQKRGQLRSDLRAEVIARAILSLNLGYIVARALMAPDVDWDDEAEITVNLDLLLGAVGAG